MATLRDEIGKSAKSMENNREAIIQFDDPNVFGILMKNEKDVIAKLKESKNLVSTAVPDKEHNRILLNITTPEDSELKNGINIAIGLNDAVIKEKLLFISNGVGYAELYLVSNDLEIIAGKKILTSELTREALRISLGELGVL